VTGADLPTVRRRKTRAVRVGGLVIGGTAPVVVQEMTTASPSNIEASLREIALLAGWGCRLVRVALPDVAAARAVKALKEETGVALVGDVHFDERIALEAIESGIDKLRLNPGNIGGARGVERVARAARERGIPIRVGVNAGSLETHLLERFGGPTAEGMVESALGQVSLLEAQGFSDIVVSLKSSDVAVTIAANILLSSKVDYPLHIGVTEAGYGEHGAVRSALGLGVLLLKGIGDTVRVSLTSGNRLENLALCGRVLDSLGIPRV
jgi:(E)-4-hydroxy-3-methylbut-2-enyl-diphosphate synthase